MIVSDNCCFVDVYRGADALSCVVYGVVLGSVHCRTMETVF